MCAPRAFYPPSTHFSLLTSFQGTCHQATTCKKTITDGVRNVSSHSLSVAPPKPSSICSLTFSFSIHLLVSLSVSPPLCIVVFLIVQFDNSTLSLLVISLHLLAPIIPSHTLLFNSVTFYIYLLFLQLMHSAQL